VPDSGTLLIHCGKVTAEGRNEFGPPVLSKIPYVNRLFKNVGYGREEKDLFLLVTPRIIAGREGEEACEPGVMGAGCSAIIGTGVNSDAGLKGSVVLNERNFSTAPCCKAEGCCKGPFPLAEVAQLSAAGISDEIIINQIITSGTCYTLDAKAILWLKQHGASDAVVLHMQSTRPRMDKAAAEEAASVPNAYSEEPTQRMRKLLTESESSDWFFPGDTQPLKKAQPAARGYERLNGPIGP